MALHDQEPPRFDQATQEQVWRAYRPKVIDILNQIEEQETWVPEADDEINRNLQQLVTAMATNDREATLDECKRLCFCMSGVSVKQCLYAFAWLDRRKSRAAASVVIYAHQHRATNQYAGAVWQRLLSVQKAHLVDDLVALAEMTGVRK